jgi:sigma-B regulation protein RsbU (phosphoserine phosphatase)
LTSTKILIVDDTPVNLKILGSILRREGWDVVEATDGGMALEVARSEHPDLILLDIMMPVKDGYEVCAELKNDLHTANVPVVFLSALGDSEDKIKGLELGAVDFLTKPVDRAEVVARVRTHLKLRELTTFLLQLNQELQEKQSRHEQDLAAASEIQRSLLPQQKLELPRLKVTWRFQPCDELGGDLFNVERLDENTVLFYILDVAGHGVPSSLVAVSVAQLLSPGAGLVQEYDPKTNAQRARGPGEILQKLDEEYPIDRLDRHFTIFLAVLDLTTGRLRYSAAAHPPALMVRPSGELARLEEGGSLIGMGGYLPFEEGEVTLASGDRIFLCTDGIPEQPDPDGELFGVERFEKTLRDTVSVGLSDACNSVITELLLHGGGCKPPDDISLLALEYEPDHDRGGGA